MPELKMYTQHAVILFFDYGHESDEPFYQLGSKLDRIMQDQNLGIYDGHEMCIDNSHGSYYLYGNNAEQMYKAIKPILDKAEFMKGGTAYLRFGPAARDTRDIEIEI